MDAFQAYAEGIAPTRGVRRSTPATGAVANTHAEALARRDRERRILSALARRQERAATKAALARPEGRRLAAMLRWMRTLGGDQAGEFLAVLAGEDWLRAAPEDFRRVAQRLFGRVVDHLRRRAGLHPLDDPLPWDPDGDPVDSVHTRIKQLLDLR